LRFYPQYQRLSDTELVEGSSMTVEEASSVVRFPDDWSKKHDSRNFRWNDVQFLFARTVRFFLDSEDLRQLRAVLVDCPGLHASRWDNEIVHQSIAQSDAVIWLQGGEGKELGQSDLLEAKQFGDYGITSNGVFLAFNARGVGKRISEKILDSNLDKMRQHAQIDVPPERVVIFNALLALRAKQAVAMKAGALSENTLEALSAKARDQVDPEKLPEGGIHPLKNAELLIGRDIQRQALQFLDEDVRDAWDGTQLAELADKSQWRKVITQATQFIVQTRGRTRLIDKGANLVSVALERFEESLQSTEVSLTDKLEDHKAKKKAAEQSLKQFEQGADSLVRRFEQSIDDCAEGVGAEVGEELFNRLRKGKKSLLERLEAAIDRTERERHVRGGIGAEAALWMRSIISGWQVDVRAGKSVAMRGFYENTLRGVESDIRQLLRDSIGQGGGLLRSVVFEIPKPSEHVLSEYQASPMEQFKNIDGLIDQAEKKCPYLEPLRNGYEKLRKMFTGQRFDRGAWKKRLPNYWETLLSAFNEDIVEKVASPFLKAYGEAVVDCIDRSKETLRAEFEERLQERESELQKSQEERRQNAEHAKDIRTRVIQPFQHRIEQFVGEVKEALESASPDATDPHPR
jgi:hypothetical protein